MQANGIVQDPSGTGRVASGAEVQAGWVMSRAIAMVTAAGAAEGQQSNSPAV